MAATYHIAGPRAADFGAAVRMVRTACRARSAVGWVERSETHRSVGRDTMGFTSFNPSYGLRAVETIFCRLFLNPSSCVTQCRYSVIFWTVEAEGGDIDLLPNFPPVIS